MRVVALSLALLGALPGAAGAQTPAAPPAPTVTVEGVRVEPSGAEPRPLAADTLCRLTVTLRNTGTEKASALGFRVRVNGQDLPVYANHLFYYLVEPGKTADLRLYNFWTTETSRPFPKDAKLAVEVALTESQWMRVAMEEGVEVWTPLGAVAGLPSAKAVTLDLQKPAG